MQTRQKYIDGHILDAQRAQCDTVQLKYDGWWSRIVIDKGHWDLYSRTGRHLLAGESRTGTWNGVLIGEYMFGTQWSQNPKRTGHLYLFDCWELSGVQLYNTPYRDRFGLLRTSAPYWPDWWKLIANYPITHFDQLWANEVLNGEYEGVVFRRSASPVIEPLIRYKRTLTDEYVVLGFEEGDGKHKGRLGTLLCGTKKFPTQIVARVGNGFSDEERETIWSSQASYLNRWFEVEGKARFETTYLLRHPTFVRWRDIDDVDPSDDQP
jgi:ATP-dependent DNA ligase